jgi:hypothetical protein
VIEIPDKYITSGTVPTKVMDLGELNLEVELDGKQALLIINKTCRRVSW